MSPRYRAAVAATMSSVMILQVILMAGIIVMSVLGNLLVVVSVMCVRLLRQPPNLLLLALAVTDLFVSLVVMPGESKATDSYTQFKEVTTTLKASNSYLEGVVQIRHHHIKGNWNLSLTLLRTGYFSPGALLQEVVGAWPLRPVLCVAWVFADVFLCTSSILSLTAICIGQFQS